jgi:hypothetical protein
MARAQGQENEESSTMELRDRLIDWMAVAKVDPITNCFNWTGSKNKKGYGRIMVSRVGCKLAHRVIYKEFIEDPRGLCVLHRCDNPSCINPDHLYLGTNQDNVDDRVARGRQTGHWKGTGNPHSVLNEETVLHVRRLSLGGLTVNEIAKQLGLKYPTIWDIVNNITWKNLHENVRTA